MVGGADERHACPQELNLKTIKAGMRSRRPCMGEFMRLGACNIIELIPAHKDALYKLVSWITDSEAVCMLPKHFNNPGSFHFKLILERTRQ